jgi:glycosyltransferase involved in cell wall biosynthesis
MSKIILAFDTGFNREAGGMSILYFSTPEQLATLVDGIEESYGSYLHLGELARQRVSQTYDWDKVIDDYDFLSGRE